VFAERGAGVDVREIARTAGVGMGTLFRHFPTKELLIEAVLSDMDARWRTATTALLDLDDPWVGLRRFMEDTLERHSTHRGLLESFSACFDALPEKGGSYVTEIEPVWSSSWPGCAATARSARTPRPTTSPC
jgi:AcrR family transcriptional regulator